MNLHESGAAVGAHAVADVVVLIPSGLLRFTGQVKSIDVQAETVGQALRQAADRFPMLRAQMFGGDGQLRRFINIFCNSQDIRFLQQEHTALHADDVITILPAIAGG